MKREIKYKALRADGKGWVYGYYWFQLDEKIHWIVDSSDITNQFGVQVDPETVCQYVGKKQNIEICESDKVCVNYGRYHLEPNGITRTGGVIFDDKTFSFVVKIDNSQVRVPFDIINEIEVIGNIHDKTDKP